MKTLPPVELVPTKNLIEYSFNSKIHTREQIDRIANSISRFGWASPIAINENNIILAGHGRYQAALKLKLDKVPVVKMVGLTESEQAAFRIVDNKVAADTSWDLGNLELEVKALTDAGYDAGVFHFEEFKFEAPPEEPEKKEEEKPHQWLGQIKIKVPADTIDSFEQRLNELISEFEGIEKEVKRMK